MQDMPGPYSIDFPERDALLLVQRGYIEVRPDGSIWRLKHLSRPSYQPRRIDAASSKRTPHRTVRLTMLDGETRNVGNHRLVWQFYKGDIPEGFVVNHKDGDPSNNRIDNLELLTQSENQKHRFDVLGHKGALTMVRDRYEALVQATREAVATGQIGSLREALDIFDGANNKWRGPPTSAARMVDDVEVELFIDP